MAALLLPGCLATLPSSLHPAPKDPLADLVVDSPFGASPDRSMLDLGDAQAWLVERFGPGRADHPAVLHKLTSLLSVGGELEIQYDPLAVHGASETFRVREGNCLSQTTLFIALARSLGMRAHFWEVYQAPDWIEEGDLRIKNRHVAARVRINGWGSWEVDFGEAEPNPRALGRSITDLEARAHHFNNLGVAALAQDENEEAIRHFNRALLLAPRMAFAWANLGTTLMRLDMVAEAEAALRESVRLDPHEVVALTSLERLYGKQGEPELASAMRRLAEQARYQNPFVHYDLGLTALREERAKAAVKHLEKALKGLPELVQLRADLARAYFADEQVDKAKRTFRQAHALASSDEERNLVKRTLIALTKGEEDEPPAPLALKSRKLKARRPSAARPDGALPDLSIQ